MRVAGRGARELLVERIAPGAAGEHEDAGHVSSSVDRRLGERAHAAGAEGDLGRPHLLDAVHDEGPVEHERALRGRAAEHHQLERPGAGVRDRERPALVREDDEVPGRRPSPRRRPRTRPRPRSRRLAASWQAGDVEARPRRRVRRVTCARKTGISVSAGPLAPATSPATTRTVAPATLRFRDRRRLDGAVARRHHLERPRQRGPELDAVLDHLARAVGERPLRMHDAAPGRHPLRAARGRRCPRAPRSRDARSRR